MVDVHCRASSLTRKSRGWGGFHFSTLTPDDLDHYLLVISSSPRHVVERKTTWARPSFDFQAHAEGHRRGRAGFRYSQLTARTTKAIPAPQGGLIVADQTHPFGAAARNTSR